MSMTILEPSPEPAEAELDAPVEPEPAPQGNNSNLYVRKKVIAQGMLDVALLSSNTNQLVHLLETQSVSHELPFARFRLTAIVLLIISIILQLIVGSCLIAITLTNKRVRRDLARRLNYTSIVLIFFITVLNILIPSFTPSEFSRVTTEVVYNRLPVTVTEYPCPSMTTAILNQSESL